MSVVCYIFHIWLFFQVCVTKDCNSKSSGSNCAEPGRAAWAPTLFLYISNSNSPRPLSVFPWTLFLSFLNSSELTATLNFWRWFCSLRLELARPNHINRKFKTFKRCLVMQKNTSKSYASQTRLCKSWIERHWNIWKFVLLVLRCYAISIINVWTIFGGSLGTVNQTTSCQHTLSKKNH